MKEVNLAKIYEDRLYVESCATDSSLSYEKIALLAMREACNQIVDLCAENAEDWDSSHDSINLDSILKTKGQIKWIHK